VTAVEILKAFLEEEKAIPLYDESGKVVTFRGGEAAIRAQAIKEGIMRIEAEAKNE